MQKQELEKMRTKCEIFSRVVGYIRPIQNWNVGKRAEFKDRVVFEETISLESEKVREKCKPLEAFNVHH
tara:strand:- start:141 stop:347 length:207 start_codon:yes stop_codon:yes gene_type:complete